jgi:hypothetical protein
MAPKPIFALQLDIGRVGCVKLVDGDLTLEFVCKPIHDGRHFKSGRSVVSVKHDQGWPFNFWRGRIGRLSTATRQKQHKSHE